MLKLTKVKGSFYTKTGHTVYLSRFVVSPQISVEIWKRLGMFDSEKHTDGSPDEPITGVTWHECQEFIKRINSSRPDKFPFWRLPTRAEAHLAMLKGVFKSAGEWCQDYELISESGDWNFDYIDYCYLHNYDIRHSHYRSDRNTLNYTTGLRGLEQFDPRKEWHGSRVGSLFEDQSNGLRIPIFNPKGLVPGETIECLGVVRDKQSHYRQWMTWKLCQYKKITIRVPDHSNPHWGRVVAYNLGPNREKLKINFYGKKPDERQISTGSRLGFRLCRPF